MHALLAVLLAAGLGLAAPVARADDDCPPGLVCRAGSDGVVRAYRRGVRHRTNEGLIIAGAVLLGGGWLINVPLSGATTLLLEPDATARPGDYFGWSFVPLAGPIVQMFQVGTQHWDIPILAVVEAVQILGVIMAAIGTAGEDVNVLEPVETEALTLRLLPWAGEGGAGLRVLGAL